MREDEVVDVDKLFQDKQNLRLGIIFSYFEADLKFCVQPAMFLGAFQAILNVIDLTNYILYVGPK